MVLVKKNKCRSMYITIKMKMPGHTVLWNKHYKEPLKRQSITATLRE